MKDTLTSVILSIKPIYAKAIMAGKKKVEFRKKIFKKPVDTVFVYSSAPEKRIIGFFTIGKIVEDSPDKLWEKFGKVGGIKEKDFFEYYKNVKTGFSISVATYKEFKTGANPDEFFEKFCAPQSYLYLEETTAANILNNK
jgi:predicted transcriptional regulator